MRQFFLAICIVVACACGSGGSGGTVSEPKPLREVTLPELARVDAPVQAQIRERYEAVQAKVKAGVVGRELGAAFGDYGMVLHAAEYLDAALPAYLNAQALMPEDPRWPYYLATLYRARGGTPAAMASYARVLELRPGDVAALVWLGRMYMDTGQPERAEPLFTRARAASPNVIAAQVGLGQVALAKKDYARAAQIFEEVLAVDPNAASVYAPLAMAYRGLGQTERAEAASKSWRNSELPVPDPLKNELDMSVQSGLSYELRGVQALESGDYKTAADLFTQGVALAKPGSTLSRSLRHKTGTALALSGDVPGAVEQFEETIRQAPPSGLDEPAAKAHYSLGVLHAGSGRNREAVTHFESALAFNPNYLEARLALADVLRISGRTEASLPHYAEAVRMNPRLAWARFAYAVGLVRLGRYAEARAWLEESVSAQPDRPELAHALARVLASAPDAKVRDGARALSIARTLLQTNQNTELGETLAMALAETGSFTDAAATQRDVLAAAKNAGDAAAVQRMTANLRLYESGRPSRSPWPADHPVHTSVAR